LETDVWGFEVGTHLKSYSVLGPSYDNIYPQNQSGGSILEDFLKRTYAFIRTELKGELGDHIVENTPIDYCLSTPSRPPDVTGDGFVQAVESAGFGSLSSGFNLIREEAAGAFAALKSEMGSSTSAVMVRSLMAVLGRNSNVL
jgi:hypothetical protein